MTSTKSRTLCSAGRPRRAGGSCFTAEQLRSMCKRMGIKAGSREGKRVLWDRLNTAFQRSGRCGPEDERCWARLTGEGSQALPPSCPTAWRENDRTWLTNFDILDVMSQYETRYRSFHFAGVFPVDASQRDREGTCVVDTMCALDVRALSRRYAQLGFVFNLDRHDQPGSHWVAVYVGLRPSLPNYGVYYFDSVGQEPPAELAAFLNSVVARMNDPRFRRVVNTERKQYKNTECGMFSINFLVQCLQRRRFDSIVRDRVFDDQVHRLRYAHFGC
jgi:hypothetical protein